MRSLSLLRFDVSCRCLGRFSEIPIHMKKNRLLPRLLDDLAFSFFSEADQKKNPSAVVTALKFYAKTVMAQESEKQKFMLTKSQLPSDDDVDEDYPQTAACKADSLGNSKLLIF